MRGPHSGTADGRLGAAPERPFEHIPAVQGEGHIVRPHKLGHAESSKGTLRGKLSHTTIHKVDVATRGRLARRQRFARTHKLLNGSVWFDVTVVIV